MDTQELFDQVKPRYPELMGKVAIVTGSSRGIGKGIAINLAKEGMKVILNGVNPERLKTTTQEFQACGADVHGILADMGDKAEINQLFEETQKTYGRVDLLVNNAAVLRRTYVYDFDETSLEIL